MRGVENAFKPMVDDLEGQLVLRAPMLVLVGETSAIDAFVSAVQRERRSAAEGSVERRAGQRAQRGGLAGHGSPWIWPPRVVDASPARWWKANPGHRLVGANRRFRLTRIGDDPREPRGDRSAPYDSNPALSEDDAATGGHESAKTERQRD